MPPPLKTQKLYNYGALRHHLVMNGLLLPKMGTMALLSTFVPMSSLVGFTFPHPATTASLPWRTMSCDGRQMGIMWNAFPASVISSKRATSYLSGWVVRNWKLGWTNFLRTCIRKCLLKLGLMQFLPHCIILW